MRAFTLNLRSLSPLDLYKYSQRGNSKLLQSVSFSLLEEEEKEDYVAMVTTCLHILHITQIQIFTIILLYFDHVKAYN